MEKLVGFDFDYFKEHLKIKDIQNKNDNIIINFDFNNNIPRLTFPNLGGVGLETKILTNKFVAKGIDMDNFIRDDYRVMILDLFIKDLYEVVLEFPGVVTTGNTRIKKELNKDNYTETIFTFENVICYNKQLANYEFLIKSKHYKEYKNNYLFKMNMEQW